VLLLQGEQGSAKSSAERLLRALVDPSVAPLRTTPRNEHDLFIAATSAWVIALDNISNLQPWLSDALCRLSTGGGFSTRTLYENREQELFDATRPLVANGIADVATWPDLLDRGIIVPLPHIPDEERKPETELWAAFERARPAILGALFNAVAGALGAVSSLRLERMPRMADFALWVTAAEDALGWEAGAFMDAYTGNRKEATETAFEADPVAEAVRAFMEKRTEWTGTAGELWKELSGLVDEEVRHTKAWPGAPNALSGRLKRLAPALRGIGVEYGEDREGKSGARRKKLTKTMDAKDRQNRQSRQPNEKSAKESLMQADGSADDLGGADDAIVGADDNTTEDRRGETLIDKPDWAASDDADSSDGNLRPDSKETSSWANDPMRTYPMGGSS
jgi:hypothetical protein